MGPVAMAAIVTAVISSVGTILAAWIQARAQRPTKRGGQSALGRASADGRDRAGERLRTPPQ
jgi:hypothetical protein